MSKKMTSRQRIDASHEARLWIKDVIIPAITACVVIDRVNPMLKYNIQDKYRMTKERIQAKFKKEEES